MSPDDFLDSMVAAIVQTGVDPMTAERWAALIGDTPEMSDDDSFVIVRERDGTELARLPTSILE